MQLFPSWQGGFDGSRPSLAGLDNEAVIRALETGLMTQHEVASLMNLIKSPEVWMVLPCVRCQADVFIVAIPQSPLPALLLLSRHPQQVPLGRG